MKGPFHPVARTMRRMRGWHGMAWQQLQKSQSHEPATPTELSFSFAELLSIRSSTPEPGAPLSTVVRRILECAVAVGKNRGHHHCGRASLTSLLAYIPA